jgi:hypothetical protein
MARYRLQINFAAGKTEAIVCFLRARFSVAPLQARLDIERLRYAARVSAKGTVAIRAMLQGKGASGWRVELRAAIATLQLVSALKLDVLPALVDDTAVVAWEAVWLAHPRP